MLLKKIQGYCIPYMEWLNTVVPWGQGITLPMPRQEQRTVTSLILFSTVIFHTVRCHGKFRYSACMAKPKNNELVSFHVYLHLHSLDRFWNGINQRAMVSHQRYTCAGCTHHESTKLTSVPPILWENTVTISERAFSGNTFMAFITAVIIKK